MKKLPEESDLEMDCWFLAKLGSFEAKCIEVARGPSFSTISPPSAPPRLGILSVVGSFFSILESSKAAKFILMSGLSFGFRRD